MTQDLERLREVLEWVERDDYGNCRYCGLGPSQPFPHTDYCPVPGARDEYNRAAPSSEKGSGA